jgi:hypothetical protein
MKATEQQAYADAVSERFHPTQVPIFPAGPAYHNYGGIRAQERFAQDSIFPDGHPMRGDYHNYGGPRAEECFVHNNIFPGGHSMRDDYHSFRGQSIDSYPTSGWVEEDGMNQTAFASPPFMGHATSQPNDQQFHRDDSHLRDQGCHDSIPWSQAGPYAHQPNFEHEQQLMPGRGYGTHAVSQDDHMRQPRYLNSQVSQNPSPNFADPQSEGGFDDDEDALFRAAFL